MTDLSPGARVEYAAPGPGPGLAHLLAGVPELDGVLSVREEDLAEAGEDFGHVVRRRPLAVLYPRSAADVAAIVRFGRERALPVVPRGAGHTVDGQAQIRDGIVVNLASLAGVGEPGPGRISVFVGARWRAVVDATLPAGLTPPVLPDYLELSVGGTLSAGGFGGASHQHGCIADNVYDLDVVTPSGELVTCSPTHDSDLFDAVRGTQGEYGIIVRATLALTPANSSARRYLLTYRELPTFLADQRRLIADRRFYHVGGQAQLVPGEGWRYVLEAVTTFTAPDQPDDDSLLGDLGHERDTVQAATTAYVEFLDRIGPFEAHLRAIGSWQHHPHPRCNVLLPGEQAEEIISDFLADLTADGLGSALGGSVLLYSIPTALLAAPNMPKAQDPISIILGVQRTAPADDPGLVAEMKQANLALHSRARSVGGASYTYPTAYHESLHR
jgi:cytokinin dehydrogenase